MKRKIGITATLLIVALLVGYILLSSAPAVAPTPSPTPHITATLPYITSTPSNTPTASPTHTPTATLPATFTPTAAPTPTLSPTLAPQARVSETWTALNLRAEPNTEAGILQELPGGTPLAVVGRTVAGDWVQVMAPDGTVGWVMREYVDLMLDLAAVPITGQTAPTESPTPPPSLITGITAHAREIYLRGREMGNRGNVFSKVGDSITAMPYYLLSIGQGNYALRGHAYLEPTVRFFSTATARTSNAFANDSLAAWGGWVTRDLLDAGSVQIAGVCQAGEIPLVCEYRMVRPAVAIIMIGTNDSHYVPNAEYESNLRYIVQTTIEMGIIPVLSTLPPKGVAPSVDPNIPVMNQIITTVARGYDIPLMDYYSAMLPLPRTGLSEDTVHPSWPVEYDFASTADFTEANLQYGFTVRNLLTLQTLEKLWQQVLYDYDPAMQPPPPTAAPASAQAPQEARPAFEDYTCADSPPPRLAVGGQGRVDVEINVRSEPDDTSTRIGRFDVGTVFRVQDGPVCTSGLTWWQVEAGGLAGWVANGYKNQYWLAPQ